MTRSPSQWPGTWRPAASAGRSSIGRMPDDFRARGLLPAAGLAFLAAGAQDDPGTRPLVFRVRVDPGVDCLVRYGHVRLSPPLFVAEPARYLLGRPAFLQVAGDPFA